MQPYVGLINSSLAESKQQSLNLFDTLRVGRFAFHRIGLRSFYSLYPRLHYSSPSATGRKFRFAHECFLQYLSFTFIIYHLSCSCSQALAMRHSRLTVIGYARHFGDFLVRQAAEKFQFDNFRLFRIEFGEFI